MTGVESGASPDGSREARAQGGLKRRFGENLIVLRNRAKLSQTVTAERAGLHVTEVSLLERGLRLPQLDTIVKLGGAIGIEPCELLTGMAWRVAVGNHRVGHLRFDPVESLPIDHPPSRSD